MNAKQLSEPEPENSPMAQDAQPPASVPIGEVSGQEAGFLDPRKGLNLTGERAARRGNPSFVWRAGQERRLRMILEWGAPTHPEPSALRALVNGCGVGLYVRALADHVDQVWGLDVEGEHLAVARAHTPAASFQQGACEALPYGDDAFDFILSHEVLEHVEDDRAAMREMARVLRPGGRAVIFVPNRLYPFETHGHYWRGRYIFGNTPLINYLPDALRNRLAPHVRAYTTRGLLSLCLGLPLRVVRLTQIYPGYDNLSARHPVLGRWIRRMTYALETSPLRMFGISHLLVVEKERDLR
jgi:SAM-dependent methyltransferase